MGTNREKGIWRRGLRAAIAAAVGNLGIYGAGRAAEVTFVVPGFQEGAGLMQIPAGQVLFVSLFAVGVGTAVASLAARRGRLSAIRWLGAIVALVSVGAPLSLDAETSTKLLLAVMHVVVGASFVAALRPDPDAARSSEPTSTSTIRAA